MAITVREALKIGAMKECVLIAGAAGLDNPISYSGTMETPGIRPWLVRHQLLMTTGYAIKNDPKGIASLLQDLYDMGCSALAIKTKFTGPIPPEAIALSNTLKIPLIEMPAEMPFVHMMNPLNFAIADEHAKMLEFSQNIHSTFLELELNGGDLHSIAAMLSSLMNASVKITTEHFSILAQNDRETKFPLGEFETFLRSEEERLTRFQESNDSSLRFLREEQSQPLYLMVRKIHLKQRLRGYLFVCSPRSPEQFAAIILDHAATVSSLELSKQQALQEQHRLMENHLLIDLIAGNVKTSEEAAHRAANLGWPTPPFSTAVFDVDGFEEMTKNRSKEALQHLKEELASIMRQVFDTEKQSAIIINKSDSFSCLLPGSYTETMIDAGARQVVSQAQEQLNVSLSGGIHTGILGYDQLSTHYQDIRDAITITRALGLEKRYAFTSEVRVDQIILRMSHDPILQRFVADTVQRLSEHDQKHDAQFTITLELLVKNMGVRTKTAEQLYLHRNTLTYRIKRMEMLIERDLSSSEELLALGIALKAQRYLQYHRRKALMAKG